LGSRAGILGDDCALIAPGAGTLAISVDLSVEGVHFRRDWLSAEEIGWRATAAALSDLAAEGAEAVGVLSSVALPRETPSAELEALMRGVGAAVAAVGGVVFGGDLSRAPQWIIDVTAVGRARRPVTRAGARAGDGVWVTGALGAARAALHGWEARQPPADALRLAFARPEPRLAAGRWLAEHDARAMLDLSDGLGGDAGHLAAASGVAIEIDLERIPLAPGIEAAARRANQSQAHFAALGGEDYELLVALPPEFGPAESLGFQRACGLRLTRIGSVVEGAGARFQQRGEIVPLRGYDHFA
jgi:thiamine-monophosphate kinase